MIGNSSPQVKSKPAAFMVGCKDDRLSIAYRITLDGDGAAEILKADSTAYHVVNFECDCPDKQGRGGSYAGHCKHEIWVSQLRPCELCGGLMALGEFKTGDIRDIPVNDPLAGVLSRHPRHISCPYVLYGPDGTLYTDQAMRDWMERAVKRTGIRAHPHLLRHTFGTTLAAAGVDLDTIRRLMGHRDIHMTMRYLHAAPDRMKGAVENLPFGRPIAQNLDSRADERS